MTVLAGATAHPRASRPPSRGAAGASEIRQRAPGASAVILANRPGLNPRFDNVGAALQDPRNHVRLFGRGTTRVHRRMGVVVTYGDSVEDARERATAAAGQVRVVVEDA